jgi:hypothetical protein
VKLGVLGQTGEMNVFVLKIKSGSIFTIFEKRLFLFVSVQVYTHSCMLLLSVFDYCLHENIVGSSRADFVGFAHK